MKSVYAGGEKVAEFESYDELRVGDGKPAFIYEGNELVYPNPIKDGLVLWYDFSGRTNADGQRGVAEDLSGNVNHGTLQNFNYTDESGYDKNKLLFDGVDDEISVPPITLKDFTLILTVEVTDTPTQFFTHFSSNLFYIRKLIDDRIQTSIALVDGTQLNFATRGVFNEVGNSKVSIGMSVDNTLGNLHLISNGDIIESRVFSESMETSLQTLGRWSSHVENMDGSILSTQIYNRPLTPEEIAHNFAIEKERFGIE